MIIGLMIAIPLLVFPASAANAGNNSTASYYVGVWDNFEFNGSADNWSTAAHTFGGQNGVVDLVIAQARENGLVALSFPYNGDQSLYSASQNDSVEPYLEKFDSEGLNVILSVQPLKANVTDLIDMILTRYGNHTCIVGINVDLEWKDSGNPQNVSNEERDMWLSEIKSHDPRLKLFLTYFGDHTHFPEDANGLVVLFDGSKDSQAKLLNKYSDLAKYYKTVGIYTGYSSSDPPIASLSEIFASAPNTEYIIHTDDVFANKKTVIFELDDLQVGWLESTSIDLIDLHINRHMPVVLGVIPNNLNNSSDSASYLPVNLKGIYDNYSNLLEISQHGWTHSSTEQMDNLSYDSQKAVIENGQNIFASLGIKPVTFTPPYGEANEDTVKLLEDHGFHNLVLYSWNNSLVNKTDLGAGFLVTDSFVPLLDSVNTTSTGGYAMKSPGQLMNEIDGSDSNVVFILYHIQDFAPGSGNSIDQLGELFDKLNESKKYQFMTVSEYHDMLTGKTPTPTTTSDASVKLPVTDSISHDPIMGGPNIYYILGSVFAIFIVIVSILYYNNTRKKK